jgi:hypothetical protein
VKPAWAIALVCACGGGDDEASNLVTASAEWDGDAVALEAECAVSESGDLRVIDGVDPALDFGVSIVWNAATARTGVVYETEVAGTLSLHVVRPHPTEPDTVRVSSAGEGHAEFTALGTAPGDLIAGTFDDLLMTRDDPDDTITVTMTGGAFECVVPNIQ